MSLKVFNLQCDAGHLFEGWFGSHDDYDTQQARSLVSCPICQSVQVKKLPSAPRIKSSRTSVPEAERQQQGAPASSTPSALLTTVATPKVPVLAELQKLQAAVLSHLREVVSGAEDVGATFADEARAIHEGQAPARSIRGTASEQERQELAEDGISVLSVPDFLSEKQLH